MQLTIQEIQKIETDILKEVSHICETNNIDYYLAYGSVLGAIRHGGPIPWDTDLDIIIPINQFNTFIKCINENISDKYYFEYYKTNKYSTPLFGRIGLKGYSTRILHIDIFKLIGLPDDEQAQYNVQHKTKLYQRLHYIKRVQKWDLIGSSMKGKILIYIKKALLFFISTKGIERKHEHYCNLYPYKDSIKVINASGGYGKKEIINKDLYGEGKLVNYSGIQVKIPENFEEYLKHFYGDYLKFPPKNERIVKDIYTIYKL